jgi:hypothetical protein
VEHLADPIITCFIRGRRGRDRMVIGFTTTAQSVPIYSYEFESRSCRGVLDTTLCDKICHRGFPPLITLTTTI